MKLIYQNLSILGIVSKKQGPKLSPSDSVVPRILNNINNTHFSIWMQCMHMDKLTQLHISESQLQNTMV